jgi:hypothetical protein
MNYISPLLKQKSQNGKWLPSIPVSHHKKTHRPIITSGLVWGLQRNYSRHFSLDINFGAGYLFVNDGRTEAANLEGSTHPGSLQ